MPVLTVVLPNYNHRRFLPDALRSLLAQKRQPDEIIIIDDASTDDSVAIIESFLPKLANARLIINENNLGVVRNMNMGLKLASGDFIVFVAADDITYPGFFKNALDLIEAYPAAGFVSGRTDIIDENGNRLGLLEGAVPLQQKGFIEAKVAARLLMQDDSWFTGNVSIFRSELLRSCGGFSEELSAMTDGFAGRLLAVKHGVCYTPEVFGAWRRLKGGLAWSESENLKIVEKTADLVQRRMDESGAPFAPGYPERWKGRYIFGAKRFILRNRTAASKSAGKWSFAVAVVQEILTTAWLFATLRPRDLVSVSSRRFWRK